MMSWLRRGGCWLGAGLLLVLLLAGVLAAYFVTGALPVTAGDRQLAGLRAVVTVTTNADGVPHLRAETMLDLARAQGYWHASQRLFQMEMQRRAGAGRLAEVLGPELLPLDRTLRTLGLYAAARATVPDLAPDYRAALEAYASGVNDFISAARASPLRRQLPLELHLLQIDPEPWQPADSLVWGKLMALQLSSNMDVELLRGALGRRLTARQLDDLFPPANDDRPATLAWGDWQERRLPRQPEKSRDEPMPVVPARLDEQSAGLLHHLARFWPVLGPRSASNGWVLSGRLTESGWPLLANDPHLQLRLPVLWYVMQLATPDRQWTGASVPGVPGILLGHNGQIAWGMTTTGGDAQDLFLLPVDARGRATIAGQPIALTSRTETIKIRGAAAETLTIRSTPLGPVLSDVDETARALAGRERVLVLAFAGLQAPDRTAQAIWNLAAATDWDGFRDALRDWVAPQQNIFYADRLGNIGLYAPGILPVRKWGDGTLPVAGASPAVGWNMPVPFAYLPHSLNPSRGLIANTNNAIVGPGYPYLLARNWHDSWRGVRLQELMQPIQTGKRKATLADQVRWQLDDQSAGAAALLPVLLSNLGAPQDPAAVAALALLRAWDFSLAADRPEGLIWNSWLRALNQELFAAALGDLLPTYLQGRGTNIDVLYRVLTQSRDWCDQQGGSCRDIVTHSFDRALAALRAAYGAAPADWRWGTAHRASLEHPVFRHLPLLRDWTARQVGTAGDHDTLNRGASFDGAAELSLSQFSHNHGAGFRAIYDLADLDASLFITAGGQSGHIIDATYAHFTDRWRVGDYIRLPATPGAGAVFTLRP